MAYVNATAIYGDKVSEYESRFLAKIEDHAPKTTYDDGVVAGYKAIYNTTVSKIFDSPIGQLELLFMNSDGNGDIGVTAALQHPLSHGRIYINSSNPMDYPVIDPNYLANPAGMYTLPHHNQTKGPSMTNNTLDSEILLAGIKLARQVGETIPMSKSLTKETSPGSKVQSDEDWTQWLREEASTEFHPSSSCAMLPKEQGGVVDANLRVYGLANVRVADASVIPIALSTHLMASTYGVAEQASDIIRKYYMEKPSEPEMAFSSSSSSPIVSAVAAKKSAGSDIHDTSSGSGRVVLSLGWTSMLLLSVHVVGAFGLSF